MREDALWRCPKCGRAFANRNQTHTCRPLHDLAHHFAGREPIVRELYDLDIDATFIEWTREAYAVGAQQHLASRTS